MTSSPRHINYITYRRSTVNEDEIFGPPTLKFKLVVSARSRRTILVIQENALIRVPRKAAKCIPLKIAVAVQKKNCHSTIVIDSSGVTSMLVTDFGGQMLVTTASLLVTTASLLVTVLGPTCRSISPVNFLSASSKMVPNINSSKLSHQY